MSRFDGREDGHTLGGEVTSVMLGADWTREPATVGLLLTHSRADGEFRGKGEGEVEATLTGLYPYGRYVHGDRFTVWGVAGYGEGALTLAPAGEAPLEAELDLGMAGAGGRGVLVEAPGEGGLELSVKPDALVVRTSSQEAAGGGLEAARGDVTRLRIGLEGTWRGIAIGASGTLTPAAEIGLRHDGGDAETGFGVDVGGAMAWSLPQRGLSADLSARGLLTHEADGMVERGFAGSLAWDPRPESARGLALEIRQTVGGQSTGGMDALLGLGTLEKLAANGGGSDLELRRLEVKLGYGVPAFGGRFTTTPELGLGVSGTQREYTLGWRLERARSALDSFELSLSGTRRETAGDAAPSVEHTLTLRASLRW